jgi:hypothetical protein
MSLTIASTSNAFSKAPEKLIKMENANEKEALKLINRLNEIKAMDPSSMTRKEKREMRREVKSINHKLETNNDGVYLSVGAVIIIILLLILLL